jgi:hypothetical protein
MTICATVSAHNGVGSRQIGTSMLDSAYETDLTDEQWTFVAPLIPPAKPGGRPAHDRCAPRV